MTDPANIDVYEVPTYDEGRSLGMALASFALFVPINHSLAARREPATEPAVSLRVHFQRPGHLTKPPVEQDLARVRIEPTEGGAVRITISWLDPSVSLLLRARIRDVMEST